jgi:ectoine hydroxylase-related dioxygenase (phytanoyl-CoA dioxygenase family)
MEKIQHYGINELTISHSLTEVHAEEILLKGYTIVTDVLLPEDVKVATTKLIQVYHKQLAELDKGIIETINDIDIARALLVYDEFFLHKVALNPKVTAILNIVLGKYFILREQNGIINRANLSNYQLKWHRDLLYQHFVCSRPCAVSVLFTLLDFNNDNGGTFILPATHKSESFPSEEYIRQNEICVNAPLGSAIVFDSMLYHRAGRNVSQVDRMGINNMYVQPYIKQSISFPKMLNGRYSDDPFLNLFLGYDSQTEEDVKSWRMKRFNRKK